MSNFYHTSFNIYQSALLTLSFVVAVRDRFITDGRRLCRRYLPPRAARGTNASQCANYRFIRTDRADRVLIPEYGN